MKDFNHNFGPLERKDATGGDGGEGEQKKAPDTNEIKRQLEGFSKTVEQFMTKLDDVEKEAKKVQSDPLVTEELKKINEAITTQQKQVEALRLAEQRPMMMGLDGSQQKMTDEQVEHKKAFDTWFRKGRGEEALLEVEKKTLSVGSDPDGGYTVPVQMEAAIDRVITEISPMRQVARVVQVSSASYKKRVGMGGATSGWVGEKASRPETSTPTIEELEFPVMELYAMPGATQSILDDSAINIDNWLADEVSIEFAQEEGSAFINGNGAAKPVGLLTPSKVDNDSWSWGNVGYVATGASGAFLTTNPGDEHDNLVDLVYSLKSAFRRNARFMMNDKTIGEVRKIKDADGRPLWHSGLRDGEPDRLLGYSMVSMPDMPDIGANSYSIAFGDFSRGYIIVDRIGTRVLRDPFTSKPYVLFYTTKRVGGGVGHYDAYKLMKFGTS